MRTLLILFLTLPSVAELRHGRVASVTTGDSFMLREGRKGVKVYLEGIDAPERGQEFAKEATEALRDKILGYDVEVEVSEDQGRPNVLFSEEEFKNYKPGPIVGRVMLGGRWINKKMVHPAEACAGVEKVWTC